MSYCDRDDIEALFGRSNVAKWADLNGDAEEDLTSSFADTTGFTITPAGLVAGDILRVFVRTVLQETVGSDTIHVEVGSIELQLDIKG